MNNKIMNNSHIKDVQICNDKLYFAADADISYSDAEEVLGDGELVRVPNLLRKNELGKYSFSSSVCGRLSEALKASGITEHEIKLSYKNAEIGFDRKSIDKGNAGETEENVSDLPAYIYNGDVEWERLTCHSLHELICQRKDSQQKLVYITAEGEYTQTYGEIYHNAMRLAAAMKKSGIKKGDTAIFQFANNKNFIECFWSCMLLGVAAAPVGAAEDHTSINVNTDKLNKICRTFETAFLIYDKSYEDNIEIFRKNYDLDIPCYAIEDLKSDEELDEITGFEWDVPCLYLFTSGSTGVPKAVGLTQHNIFARHIGELQMYDYDSSLSDFNWMTLSHGGGIIWSHTRDIYLDCFQVQCDTSVILQDPIKLIEYFDRFKTNISWAPNFAYTMVGEAIDDDKDYGWDLSNAVSICSGGEGNVAKTLRNFIKKVRKYGFPENGLKPVFGMTETSSCMTYYDDFTLDKTSDNDRTVSIGTPSAGVEVRVTDSSNRTVKEGEIGYIQMKGETILNEYYNNPEANRKSFTDDEFFITGDLGFIKDNNIYITGREKDVIIINGLNYYIQDIEEVADDVPEVKSGSTAVISVMERSGDSVILFFVPEDEKLLLDENIVELRALVRKVKNEIQVKSFVTLDHVIPIKESDFARTEIGKKQRNVLKKAYEENAYESVIRSVEEIQSHYAMKKSLAVSEINIKCDQIGSISAAGVDDEMYAALRKISDEFERSDDLEGIIADMSFVSAEKYGVTEPEIAAAFDKVFSVVGRYAGVKSKVKVYFPVISDSEAFSVLTSILLPVLRTMELENDNFSFKAVIADKLDLTKIYDEIKSADKYPLIRYINGKRYIETYSTYTAECDRKKASEFISGKNVIVLGGFGGIGQLLCRYLADNYDGATIVAVGRRSESDVSSIAEKYSDSDVRYKRADILDYDSLSGICKEICEETGKKIGCIFDLAARYISESEEMTVYDTIQSGKIEVFKESAAVKLSGLINADKLSREYDCRLFVFGSVTGDFGMVNMSAYSSSNMLAEEYCRTSTDAVYIALSGWNSIGMNRKKSSDDMKSFMNNFSAGKNGFLKGFTAETGIKMIDSIICSDIGSCLAGVDNNYPELRYCIDDDYRENISMIFNDKNDIRKAKEIISSDFPEIKGNVEYVLNRLGMFSKGEGELEAKIRVIWENVLGHETEGFDDNLFDIGGNSLSVFKLVSEFKKELFIDVKPIDIMTYPTISSFAGFVRNSSEGSKKKTSSPAKRKLRQRGK